APAPAPAPAAAPPLAQFAATGSSSRTVNLSWAPAAAETTYTVERKPAGGSYGAIANVDGRSGQFIDDGLAKSTQYSYRVVASGGSTVAEASVATTDEDGISTAVGAPQGEATTVTIGATGGRIAPAGSGIAIDVPAAALAADTAIQLQTVSNNAPDGRGDGLQLKLAARPSLPLQLSLAYDGAQDNDADGLRIAVQRSDGAWFSLPLAAIDKTTRTLKSELPLALLAPTPALKTAQDATVSLAFTIVKYLAFRLAPATARVEVKKTLDLVPHARVRGYDTQIGSCVELDIGLTGCLFTPILETREIPFTNSKAGYVREWNVNLVPGGDAVFGTVAPRNPSGATYTAPAQAPNPDTVRVMFESRNNTSGRSVLLVAQVTVFDNRWHGTVTTETLPSDTGTWFTAIGRVTWNLDSAASSGSTRIYRPEGTIEVMVQDDDCTVTVTPGTQPVSSNTQLVELRVDESKSPAQYALKLITFWTATIAGFCPKGSGYRQTTSAGYGWELQGDVSPDGRTIEGFMFGDEGERIDWGFTR
ncbi:MAG: fibronectin type III domain-containing protein, partial [Rubrivivax sp.]